MEPVTIPEQNAPRQRSSRDPEELGPRLGAWLATRLPPGADPVVSEVVTTSANGMSSDTILFRAGWNESGRPRGERLVARFAPGEGDVPVFPSYDLERQFRALRLVAERTSVPVPRTLWFEPDPSAVGAPFFVMEAVDGEVPPDVMPYNFGHSWLFHASPQDRRRLQEQTVSVLAELHAIDDPDGAFSFLAFREPGATPLRRHLSHTRAWYEFVAAGGDRSALIERGFDWLDAHVPAEESEPVVCWGDARIGNVIYRDFSPVGVLDWEMACLGPRELDVSWLIYGHRVFEDLATALGLPGMPDFLRSDEVIASYRSLTGRTLGDLDFYLTYAAIQWAIVFLRTGQRAVRFGERVAPGDSDDHIYNREPLERMLA